jgi:thiamine-monophosphate kinase
MLDVSDGVASDALRLAEESGLRFVLDAGALPLAEGVAETAHRLGVPAWQLGAAAGEDYELLVCVAEADCYAAASAAPLTWIGIVRAGPPAVELLAAGIAQTARGFQHRL